MMDRRAFLARSVALGCSLAASPLVTPVTFASTPGEKRLVVIILRGGMDGMAALAPYGDPGYAALRGALPLGEQAYTDLDGYHALHPGMASLLPLWQQGHLGFVHAVSTPYRDKRSHFDGQDILEAGIADMSAGRSRDGWLNRMLANMTGVGAQTAYAVGNDALTILDGPTPVSRWSPDADLALSPQAIKLAQMVMQDDPAMAAALEQAFALADGDGDAVAIDGGANEMMSMMRADMRESRQSAPQTKLAEFVASRLKEESRIAAFSLNGWDTHYEQERSLTRALEGLSQTILTLRDEMGGPVWKQTAVVAITEFGRTARFNGTRGTDHGTGGLMILSGGAIHGGRVVADWPGLADADLYRQRDLMPTRDLRAHVGWLIRGMFGIEASRIEREIFPDLDMGADPGLLL